MRTMMQYRKCFKRFLQHNVNDDKTKLSSLSRVTTTQIKIVGSLIGFTNVVKRRNQLANITLHNSF